MTFAFEDGIFWGNGFPATVGPKRTPSERLTRAGETFMAQDGENGWRIEFDGGPQIEFWAVT
jgi:hypothetical protein